MESICSPDRNLRNTVPVPAFDTIGDDVRTRAAMLCCRKLEFPIAPGRADAEDLVLDNLASRFADPRDEDVLGDGHERDNSTTRILYVKPGCGIGFWTQARAQAAKLPPLLP